jgi:hypothetical protein
MQDGVSAGKVKIRQTAVSFTEIEAVGKNSLHLFPGHGDQLLMGIAGKNIAVLAPLITFIGNMPLKSEILFHLACASLSANTITVPYLSPAPQAEPHAAGFSSGLSPAPQAEPHAAGFSAGLSPAPQAVPHAEAAFSSVSLFHPNKFESAMIIFSFSFLFCLLCSHRAFGPL